LKSIGQYSKTDKLDARGICQMACERKLRLWKPFSSEILKIRTALRYRKSLQSSKIRFTNQLHALQHSAYGDQGQLRSLRRLIKSVDKEIKAIEKLINNLYEKDEKLYLLLAPIISSLSGVGLITVLTIVAETNGFALIRNLRQLSSYAGYDIIENQSGNKQGKTRISKRGNARIRAVLYMAALSVIRYDKGPLRKCYERVALRNPNAYKVANVAVQRKLLCLIYTLFKNGTTYDPNYHDKQLKINSSEHCPELCGIVQA
jgi:transposase